MSKSKSPFNEKKRKKKQKQHKPSPFKSKIHLKDAIWSWRYLGGKVIIRSPEGKDHKTDHVKVLKKATGRDISWDELERADHKGYSSNYSIKPAMIRKIIETELVSS